MSAPQVSMLIKPVSSACNMRCAYCFYTDVAQRRHDSATWVMSDAVMSAIVDRAFAIAPDAHVTFAFQGGEPTLAGLDFFSAFMTCANQRRTHQRISYALQTNGMLIDDKWAEFLARYKVLVGLSVDGYREIHDRIRAGADGNATHARALLALKTLRAAGVAVNVLTVLSAQLARHPQRAYAFLQRESIDYVQFIPCLPGLDDMATEFSLCPEAFSSFYRAVFVQWQREIGAGGYRSIWLFDNIMEMALGHYPTQCGMLGACMPQFVIEADGEVYPCDFYALDEYRCGNVLHDDLEAIATCDTMRSFLHEPRRPCACCRDCPFEGMCHRNCKRLNIAYYDETYCGLREFLEFAYEGLDRVAHMLHADR